MSVIDDYLTTVPPDRRKELERVRNIITNTVPNTNEVISYGMPVFKHRGKYLIGLSNFSKHMSIFPGASAVAQFEDQLKDYTTSKGTVQFTVEKPLPTPLLKAIVEHCKQEIERV